MKTTITILFILIAHLAFCCDCLWQGPFSKVANNESTVVIAKVIGYDVYVNGKKGKEDKRYPTVMIVEIEEIIKPISENQFEFDSTKNPLEFLFIQSFNKMAKKRVRVIGNYNSSCRPDVKSFKINHSYFFAFSMVSQYIYYYDIDFSISNCGTTWLAIKDGYAYGNIHDENEQKLSSDGLDQKLSISAVTKLVHKN